MPEIVSQRMLARVIPFAGLPVLGAFVVFAGFWCASCFMLYTVYFILCGLRGLLVRRLRVRGA